MGRDLDIVGRDAGVFGDFVEGFTEYLAVLGYGRSQAGRHVGLASETGVWLAARGLSLSDLADESVRAAIVEGRRSSGAGHLVGVGSLGRLVRLPDGPRRDRCARAVE